MTERCQVTDARSCRLLVDPEVFLNGSNPPPTDLIDPSVWSYLMHLADHASITTSNHHGTLLSRLYALDRSWVNAIGDDRDFISTAMVDVMDEFPASIFLLLHGFYRQSISALRNVLETTLVGTYLQLSDDREAFNSWRAGMEVGFGQAADKASSIPAVVAFESRLRKALGDDLLSQRSSTSAGGWSRRLYRRLCEYSHSRPGRTNADLWQSNGPIYVARNVRRVASVYIETFSLVILLVRIARSGRQLPSDVRGGFEGSRAAWARFARRCHRLL
jgi:hypothetical protein